MDYHIAIRGGHKIASFVNKSDRDTCIDVLRELSPDVGYDYFIAVDD